MIIRVLLVILSLCKQKIINNKYYDYDYYIFATIIDFEIVCKKMDAIISYILDKFPLIAIIIIVAFIVWAIAYFYFVRFRSIENGIKNVPCKSDRGYCESLNLLTTTLNSMADDIKGISNYIIRRDGNAVDELSKKCCPFQLTDIGWLLLEDSNAQKCIDDNLSFFIDEMKKIQPKVALDVENCSLSILCENINNDFFNEIKNFVFHAPCPYKKNRDGKEIVITAPITINNVLYVMSIYLRDKFLDKYPECNTKKPDTI
jgi:hypothetical protein